MYSNAQWIDRNGQHDLIRCDIAGVTSFVPLDPANTDSQNIMALVAASAIVSSSAATSAMMFW
jgi:hypothetical protein